MTTVFVDLDATLVCTRQLKLFEGAHAPEKHFWYGFHRFGTSARPGAHDFLSSLREHYEIHILTYGNSKFQKRVLKELNLLKHIGEVYGVDNWDTLAKPERFVLIDDMPRDSILIRHKMDWLGKNKFRMTEKEFESILDRHHIQCAAFEGNDTAPSLSDLLPTIHRYLSP